MDAKHDVPAEAQGRRSRNERQGDGGLEHYCSRCKDWWPADLEFFYTSTGGRNGLHDWCKACYREWRANTPGKSRIRAQTAVVEPAQPPALVNVPWLGTAPLPLNTNPGAALGCKANR